MTRILMKPALLPEFPVVDFTERFPELSDVLVIGVRDVPARVSVLAIVELLSQITSLRVSVPAPAPSIEGLVDESITQLFSAHDAEEDCVKAADAPVVSLQLVNVPVELLEVVIAPVKKQESALKIAPVWKLMGQPKDAPRNSVIPETIIGLAVPSPKPAANTKKPVPPVLRMPPSLVPNGPISSSATDPAAVQLGRSNEYPLDTIIVQSSTMIAVVPAALELKIAFVPLMVTLKIFNVPDEGGV